MRIGIVHGPNLRLLGRREPEVYGTATLTDVNELLAREAGVLGVELDFFQSNHEGALLDHLEEASGRVDGFLVNPGAFTHTSVALRDALVGIARPFVEVHLSNTQAREPFRRHSYLSDVATGVVFGFGVQSYVLGLRGLVSHLNATNRT